MPHIKKYYGTVQEKTDEIISLFTTAEGKNSVYYGRTGNGKTRNATADILELLRRGEPVYANWQIEVPEYDERSELKFLIVGFFTNRKYYFKYGKENFHYIDPIELIDGTSEYNIDFLNRLSGAHNSGYSGR